MKKVYENCPECGLDVEIGTDKPSNCPECGKVIFPCAMCDSQILCETECPFK